MPDEIAFPNESHEYRAARNELLKAEIDLRDALERVAEKRRTLPLVARFADHAGIIVEDKGPTLSVHSRLTTDPKAARTAILDFLAAQGRTEGLGVSEGKRVVEVRPPIELSKGTSLARIVQQRSLAAAIAIGDDTTDVDMLRAVSTLTGSGALQAGLAIAVRGEETPPALLEAADYRVDGPEGVARFLRRLAERP